MIGLNVLEELSIFRGDILSFKLNNLIFKNQSKSGNKESERMISNSKIKSLTHGFS